MAEIIKMAQKNRWSSTALRFTAMMLLMWNLQLSASTVTWTGSGGNDCGGSVTQWTQMWSVRTTARQCGTITVSDHFAAWNGQGWSLGNLTSVHVNVEVGGGTGSIEFPMAAVTTTSN